MKKGPWTVVGSDVKYKNPWVELREDRVLRPDGKDGVWSVVTINPGVAVLPLDSDGHVYLAREYRYAVERMTVEAFGGGIDEGETPVDAAKRELKEESGFEADEWVDLGTVDSLTANVSHTNQLFLARNLTVGGHARDGSEIIEVLKVPFEQALAWVMDSTITHSASVGVILKAAQYLQK